MIVNPSVCGSCGSVFMDEDELAQHRDFCDRRKRAKLEISLKLNRARLLVDGEELVTARELTAEAGAMIDKILEADE